MTLMKDGYLASWAGRLNKCEIAVLARRFNDLDTYEDGVISAQKRAAAHSAKGTGATSVESGA